jgi:hypothetical protein
MQHLTIVRYGVMSTPGVVIDVRSCTPAACQAAPESRAG